MNEKNSRVDVIIRKEKKWADEFDELRKIILGCQLTEEVKWGKPCYTFQGNNILLIHGFKHYCAILFFKGALLKDDSAVLIQQTENVQSGRQIRFTDVEEIIAMKTLLAAYIQEAIDIETAGLKVIFKKQSDYPIPEELQSSLDESPGLKKAFAELTPGRQRAYILYFSAPKQAKTRTARVEKCAPQILKGKGLNDG